MALLRSPDGSWVGEVVLPVDVVNLKTRGYTEVEPEPEIVVEPEVALNVVSLDEAVTAVDKPKK